MSNYIYKSHNVPVLLCHEDGNKGKNIVAMSRKNKFVRTASPRRRRGESDKKLGTFQGHLL
ncbi:MAG: hypothetical protein LBR79_03460 [Oscillospiraceae bacterium]|jgi:hypothetical protein|nr:hypothetical protein [Oscillospiraceae bacterium]